MQQLRPAAKAYLTVVTVGALAALIAATVQLVVIRRIYGTSIYGRSWCWRRSSCCRSTSSHG